MNEKISTNENIWDSDEALSKALEELSNTQIDSICQDTKVETKTTPEICFTDDDQIIIEKFAEVIISNKNKQNKSINDLKSEIDQIAQTSILALKELGETFKNQSEVINNFSLQIEELEKKLDAQSSLLNEKIDLNYQNLNSNFENLNIEDITEKNQKALDDFEKNQLKKHEELNKNIQEAREHYSRQYDLLKAKSDLISSKNEKNTQDIEHYNKIIKSFKKKFENKKTVSEKEPFLNSTQIEVITFTICLIMIFCVSAFMFYKFL